MALVRALDESALHELADRIRPHLHNETEELLDVRAAAARLGLHRETLSRMAREDRIWAQKVGREWRFRADRLDIKPVARASVSVPGGRRRRSGSAGRRSVAAIRGRV